MKLGHSNDEIKYVETVANTAIYAVILDGEPTMHIMCGNNDPEQVIYIAPAPAADNGKGIATLGRFKMTEVFTEDANGLPLGVEKRVDEMSVYAYVIPRLHVLLGRLLRAAV